MNLMHPFQDPAAVSRYAEDTPRKVPGLSDLHRMTTVLLREGASDTARILVLGAGGGLELRAFAESQPGWQFVGVDPSAEMLALAGRIVAPLGPRIELQQGVIDDVDSGPFDGATCLLTLHFLDRDERLRTLRALRDRLRPGARLVVAHHTAPDAGGVERWLARSVAFASDTTDVAKASVSAAAMAERLHILSAEEDEAVLCDAGFTDVSAFYAAFSFRGWVATAQVSGPTPTPVVAVDSRAPMTRAGHDARRSMCPPIRIIPVDPQPLPLCASCSSSSSCSW